MTASESGASIGTAFAPVRGVRVLTKLTAVATILLIFIGSLVTSTGSGLAVPDWPLSFGGLFPPMVGGILYEHGHRVVAALVGVLIVVQAVVLSRRDPRRWVRALGWTAVAAVVVQGGFGGLTVILLLPTAVSATHAMLAQSLLLLTLVIAYANSAEWARRAGDFGDEHASAADRHPAIARWLVITLVAGYLQLFIGALMRHTEAGLAVPDFPLIGGQLLPLFDQQMYAHIAADRRALALPPVVAGQVVVHVLHRLWALGVIAAAVVVNYVARRPPAQRWEVLQPLTWLNWLIGLQVMLGAATVLTGRVPLVASLHVAVGAATLATVVLALLRTLPPRVRRGASEDAPPSAQPT